jgi:hypothetical protein
MASTNVTNIKNAFTLSSTLGANPGIQTSTDPIKNSNILNEIFGKLNTDFRKVGTYTIDKTTYETFEATLALYYRAGWYSTTIDNEERSKGSAYNPNKDKTSYNLSDPYKYTDIIASNVIGSSPKIGIINYVLKNFLTRNITSYLKLLSIDDIQKVDNYISIYFASQESALTNTDEEGKLYENKIHQPPQDALPNNIISDVTKVSGLSEARYKWIQYFLYDYFDNLETNLASSSNGDSNLKLKIKALLDNFKNKNNSPTQLKINLQSIFAKGYTPFLKVETEKPENILDADKPPYWFKNGIDNANLLNDKSTGIILEYLKKTPTETLDSLKTDLKARYQKEQRSIIHITFLKKTSEPFSENMQSKLGLTSTRNGKGYVSWFVGSDTIMANFLNDLRVKCGIADFDLSPSWDKLPNNEKFKAWFNTYSKSTTDINGNSSSYLYKYITTDSKVPSNIKQIFLNRKQKLIPTDLPDNLLSKNTSFSYTRTEMKGKLEDFGGPKDFTANTTVTYTIDPQQPWFELDISSVNLGMSLQDFLKAYWGDKYYEDSKAPKTSNIKLAKQYIIKSSKPGLGYANLAKDYIIDAVNVPYNVHIKYGTYLGEGEQKLLNFLKKQYTELPNYFFATSTINNTWDLCTYSEINDKNSITGVFNKPVIDNVNVPVPNYLSFVLRDVTTGTINSKKP